MNSERFFNNIRNKKTTSGFVELFVSKQLIHGSATALLGVFVPIYLYQTAGDQFYIVGAYYALLSLLYVLFLVPGMFFTNLIGFRHSLVVGGLFSVLVYTVMYFMNEVNFFWLLIPFTAVVLGFRIFHWVPYNVDFALFTDSGERGKMVSITFATVAFLGVIGPIMAGFIIEQAGYTTLFLIAIVLLAVATFSYAFVPETKVHFDWSYKDTWKQLVGKRYRGVVLGEFANGAESAVTIIVWPIFLYELLAGDLSQVGAVTTIIVAISIVVQLVAGRFVDKKKTNQASILKIGSSLYALGWVLKIFVLTTAQIFMVGLYHSITKIFTQTPYSTMLFDMSAEQGSYIDEFTVVREMAIHSGRFVCLVGVALLSLVMPIAWTFVIAAGASLALNLIYQD